MKAHFVLAAWMLVQVCSCAGDGTYLRLAVPESASGQDKTAAARPVRTGDRELTRLQYRALQCGWDAHAPPDAPKRYDTFDDTGSCWPAQETDADSQSIRATVQALLAELRAHGAATHVQCFAAGASATDEARMWCEGSP